MARFAAAACAAVVLAGCGGDPPQPIVPSKAGQPTPKRVVPQKGKYGALESVVPGGRYWAVYVAVGRPSDPELDDAVDRTTARGVPVGGFGALSCDRGAAESLGVPEDWFGVSVYFEERAEALRFDDTVRPPAAGVARVRTRCAE
jgi:hypothetical protein